MIKVLFVCVHNSARSQMAEAFMNQLGKGLFVAESAGLEPGVLNVDVIDSMKELGFDLANNETKSVFEFYKLGKRYHYVIKVCDQMNGQKCPIFPATKEILNWNHEDPSSFEGTKESRLAQVKVIRDEIYQNVVDFIEKHQLDSFDFGGCVNESSVNQPIEKRLESLHVINPSSQSSLGANPEWFLENEKKQFGNSVVAATNLILLDYFECMKDKLMIETLTVNHSLSLMNAFWDILYPVRQGRISIEQFVSGVEHFASSRRINVSPVIRSINEASSMEFKESALDLVCSAITNHRPVALMKVDINEQGVESWNWGILVAISLEDFSVKWLIDGKVETFNLREWITDIETSGGIVYFDR